MALVAHIVTSLVFLALGICLLTLDNGLISTIVYSFSVLGTGILFILFGAWYMIKFFFNHEYIKISNYGFTMGVILVVIGAVFIFKADNISTFIDALVCLIAIVIGAVMLQQSFSLFNMKIGAWFLLLIFGAATIGASVYSLIKPFKFFEGEFLSSVFLVAVGGLSLLSLIIMAIGLNIHKKDTEFGVNGKFENDYGNSKHSDESIFEDEPSADSYSANYSSDLGADSLFED